MSFTSDYLNIIKTKLDGLNLTKITNHIEFEEKQFLDSVYPFKNSKILSGDDVKLIADIGFGGGFPSLPVCYTFPFFDVRGFEARKKKVVAVNQIATSLKLLNFKGYHQRVEDIFFDLPCVITLKAVGKVSDFLERIKTSSADTKVLFYKGPSFKSLEPGYKAVDGWVLLEEQSYSIGENSRMFLIYGHEKIEAKPTKELVNLSTIISNK